MNIITLVTKRSVRETVPERRLVRFYGSQNFEVGTMIEIIDGNKKAPAIVAKIQDASSLKQAIRSGELQVKPIRFSKTGKHADGVTIEKFDPKEIKKYFASPALAQKSTNPLLKKFFPKTSKKKAQAKPQLPKAKNFSELSLERYTNAQPTTHTQLQELVAEIREYFNEKAVYGQGSFSYYLGFLKKIPHNDAYGMFAEAKVTRKNRFDKKKLFWWKVGQYLKKDK